MTESNAGSPDQKLNNSRQKRKRAPPASAGNDLVEAVDVSETVKKAFREQGYPMSGAIPDDEDIFEPVDDAYDFIRSTAPSPSSVGAGTHYRVDSDIVAAPEKRRSFFSLHDEEEEDEDEEMLRLRLEEVQIKRRLKKLRSGKKSRSSSSTS